MRTHSHSVLWLDFETFSEVDLKTCGADVYSRHPSTRALMLGWAIDGKEPRVWDIASGAHMPPALFPHIYLGQGLIRAHNAPFEIAILEHVLGHHIDLKQWQCCQVLAYSMGFAGRLGDVLKAVRFRPDLQKDKDGHRLIMRFCKLQPKNHNVARWTRENSPLDWARFVEYCRQDVETLRALWRFLEPYESMPQHEWDLWQMDREINSRGLPVDLPLVDSALYTMDIQKDRLKLELQQVTGMENNSRNPLMEWINARIEDPIPNLQKETKETWYKNLPEGKAKEALRLSLLIAQASSSSKWNAISRRNSAGLVRDTLQFAGAGRTRRWGGRGLQLQNLKRSRDSMEEDIFQIHLGTADMTQISTCIRGAIQAPEGQQLVVSDLGSIESRVVGWLTNCTRINDLFMLGKDTYKDLACEIFLTPYDLITKEQRTFAKPAALGCSYMLGSGGLKRYAEGMDVEMTEEVAKKHVDAFRGIYPEIPKFWSWLKFAVFACVKEGAFHDKYGLQIFMDKEFMRIQLPSGRRLNYHLPEIQQLPAPWDKDKLIDAFTYMGMSVYSNKWGRISAHMGGVCENIIQAIARDVLAVWLTRVDRLRHIDIIGHVHDEVITLVPDRLADQALDVISDEIAKPIPWAPGLLLTANGYVSKRYKKD